MAQGVEMKITETEKGSIKLVMSKAQVYALHELLDIMSLIDYESFLKNAEHADMICDLWNMLEENTHLYD